MAEFKVGCSPVTNRIMAGTVKKDGTWGVNKKDVTDTAPLAVAQHLLQVEEKIQFEYKNELYELKVVKVEKKEYCECKFGPFTTSKDTFSKCQTCGKTPNHDDQIIMERGKVDLRNCKEGDILISALGGKLRYVRPTKDTEYLDHIVEYLIPNRMGEGTRTHDGYVFAKNRMPEIDHDIIRIEPI